MNTQKNILIILNHFQSFALMQVYGKKLFENYSIYSYEKNCIYTVWHVLRLFNNICISDKKIP